jgi:hypothetical protein
MKTLLTIAFVSGFVIALAQTDKKSVVIGSMATKSNALLIINPPNSDQGVLLPQLTTAQRLNLVPSSPSEDGLMVFDTGNQSYFYWSKGTWVKVLTDKDRQVKFKSIDPASFVELKHDDNLRHANMVVFESDNSFITVSRDGAEQIMASLNLPHGAVIKEMVVYYMDNDDQDIALELIRKGLTTDSKQMVSWKSSGSSDVIKNQSFENFDGMETVDLENYTYKLVIRFDLQNGEEVDAASEAKQRIYGVRIKYEE